MVARGVVSLLVMMFIYVYGAVACSVVVRFEKCAVAWQVLLPNRILLPHVRFIASLGLRQML
jgi:hypothetical protein